ncbi:MAG: hypothetical protein JO279_14425 [Verrucomicrobia bacterium]|nr:hypothetical protein [Verrucomicrobiota bacterium]MBV8378188.1 hypothetical protein [Verrucomicrobiota bacterium]
MSRFILVALATGLILNSNGVADTDAQVAARSDVLDLAGAFQNDGFKIRDGNFLGQISKDHSQIVAVNLYSGNAYWFTASAGQKADKLNISIFDDSGKPVSYMPYQSGSRAAAGFSPDASGLYYVKVVLEEGQPATFCLIYSYK